MFAEINSPFSEFRVWAGIKSTRIIPLVFDFNENYQSDESGFYRIATLLLSFWEWYYAMNRQFDDETTTNRQLWDSYSNVYAYVDYKHSRH